MKGIGTSGGHTALIVALVALAGCGSDNSDSTKTGASTTKPPARGFSEEPAAGDVYECVQDNFVCIKDPDFRRTIRATIRDDKLDSLVVKCEQQDYPWQFVSDEDASVSQDKFNAAGHWNYHGAQEEITVSGTRSADGKSMRISWSPERNSCPSSVVNLLLERVDPESAEASPKP